MFVHDVPEQPLLQIESPPTDVGVEQGHTLRSGMFGNQLIAWIGLILGVPHQTEGIHAQSSVMIYEMRQQERICGAYHGYQANLPRSGFGG
jgi:hypothetical protein